ncbi:MAG: hypothetical protein BMS9Abin13_523 [Patescibacteria group bacterium]|nr:MAG: hypothetical protein BMS9Abin13_523 [Patescibacteria group bacterium]
MFSDPEKNIEQFGLHDGMAVADLGAGTGAYTIAAAKKVRGGGRVYAVEVQKDFLSTIKEAASAAGVSNVEFIWGDIERPGKTKIGDGMVDAVIASNVLFQVEDKKGFIGEIKRILKSGGKVLVIDWQDSFGGLGPVREHLVHANEARGLFENSGFTFAESISAGEHHWGFVMKK